MKNQSQFLLLKNYDALIVQFCASLSCLGGYSIASWLQIIPTYPTLPVIIASGGSSLVFLLRIKKVAPLKNKFSELSHPIISGKEFISSLKKHGFGDDLYLGIGCGWQRSDLQEANEFLTNDASSLQAKFIKRKIIGRYLKRNKILSWLVHPFQNRERLSKELSYITQTPGYSWISSILSKEETLRQKLDQRAGHTLIVGCAGSGKTQTMIVLIIQDIIAGRSVIIIDPKGDSDIRTAARLAVNSFGEKPKRLYEFDLAHPEKSVHLDLVSNASRASEIAMKIFDCLPKESSNSDFALMGQSFLKTICEGIFLCGQPVTFKRIYFYLHHREALCLACLEAYLKKNLPSEQFKKLKDEIRIGKKDPFSIFKNSYSAMKRSDELEAVLSFSELDEEFLNKRAIIVFQVLEKLATGDIGKLLDPEDPEAREIVSLRDIVDSNSVLLISLHAMKDSDLAAKIGSLILSDLTSLAGSRYAYQRGKLNKIALYVDEASEVLNEPFIQLLNKGRGAGFLTCLATQTVSDFVAKTRNAAEADKILANLNNLLCMRSNDGETHQYFAERIVKSTIEIRTLSHSVSASSDSLFSLGGSLSERISQTESPLVPPELLSALPNGEFFAVVSGGHVLKARMPHLSFASEKQND